MSNEKEVPQCAMKFTAAESSQPVADLAAISVSSKIPEFWVEMPRLWFAQFDAVMESQKQGDSTKYNLVIAKLNRDALQQVGDLILKPPSENKFNALKERLLVVFEESAEKQFHKLVSEMDLGTQKPSQLLRRMSGLAANTQVSDDALRRLWTARLPTAVRTVLTVTPDAKLDDLAVMADKIMENVNTGEVAAVYNAAGPDLTDQLSRMTMEMQSLRNEISEIRGRSQSRGNGWRGSRSQSRGRSQTKKNWLCRYHYRWRARARTCEQPCNWRQPGDKKTGNASTEGTRKASGTSSAEN